MIGSKLRNGLAKEYLYIVSLAGRLISSKYIDRWMVKIRERWMGGRTGRQIDKWTNRHTRRQANQKFI